MSFSISSSFMCKRNVKSDLFINNHVHRNTNRIILAVTIILWLIFSCNIISLFSYSSSTFSLQWLILWRQNESGQSGRFVSLFSSVSAIRKGGGTVGCKVLPPPLFLDLPMCRDVLFLLSGSEEGKKRDILGKKRDSKKGQKDQGYVKFDEEDSDTSQLNLDNVKWVHYVSGLSPSLSHKDIICTTVE